MPKDATPRLAGVSERKQGPALSDQRKGLATRGVIGAVIRRRIIRPWVVDRERREAKQARLSLDKALGP